MSENEIDLTKDTQQNDRRLSTRITNRASLISPRSNSPIAFNRLNNPSSLNPLQHVSSIQNSLSSKSSTKKTKQTKKKRKKLDLMRRIAINQRGFMMMMMKLIMKMKWNLKTATSRFKSQKCLPSAIWLSI